MKKRLIVALAILSILGLSAWKLMSNKEKVEAKVYRPDANQRIGVRATTVQIRDLSQQTQYLGAFAPNRKVDIRPQVGGEVLSLPIESGQSVKAGQLLAKLDDAGLRYQLEALKVNLEGAQNDLRRYEALVQGDATPAVNVEKTRLSIRATEAQIKQLQKQIAHTSITAPFSGIVTQKLIEKGSVVGAGTLVATITDISSLKLVVNIPEKAINGFKIGQSVPVSTEVYQGVSFPGKITMVGAEGDAAHNYPVEITLSNSAATQLKAGMYGTIATNEQIKEKSLSIPRQALVGSSKQPQVYVVENGKAILRTIEIGASTNEFYEVTKGLAEGDQVVSSGQINLQNGALVTIQ
jgi:RND family efflux transporter MFP subunit